MLPNFINNHSCLLIFCAFIFFSCASKKDIIYLQDSKEDFPILNFNNLKIEPGDILDIKISALNPESVLIFESNNNNAVSNNSLDVRKIQGFIVNEDGKINLPLIGDLNVSGLSTKELSKIITTQLSPYVKNPSVKVFILNFKFSVLGEVSSPGTFSVLEQKISIPQALGMAGDLTINGDRTKILIIRKTKTKTKSSYLDLTSSEFISSDYYYLKQNDIIYVRPNIAKVKSSGLIGNVGTLTSVLSLILSLTLVLTR